MFGILKCTGKLRVSAEAEQEGKTLSIIHGFITSHFVFWCSPQHKCRVDMHGKYLGFKMKNMQLFCTTASHPFALRLLEHENYQQWNVKNGGESGCGLFWGTTFAFYTSASFKDNQGLILEAGFSVISLVCKNICKDSQYFCYLLNSFPLQTVNSASCKGLPTVQFMSSLMWKRTEHGIIWVSFCNYIPIVHEGTHIHNLLSK